MSRPLGAEPEAAPGHPAPGDQARTKDEVEVWLNKQVCAGRVSQSDAQRRIATNCRLVYEEMKSR